MEKCDLSTESLWMELGMGEKIVREITERAWEECGVRHGCEKD